MAAKKRTATRRKMRGGWTVKSKKARGYRSGKNTRKSK